MHKLIRFSMLAVAVGLAPVLMGADGCLTNILNPQGNTQTVTVTVAAVSASPTSTSPVVFKATFSEDVEGLTADGLTVAGGSGAATVTGGPDVWTISVPVSADGTVSVAVKADAVTGGNDASNTASVVYEAPVAPAAPAVKVSVGTPSETVTNNGPVTYTVTYTNAATIDLAAGDVQIVATGSAGGSVTGVAAGATDSEKVVTVSGLVGDGTVAIRVPGSTAVNADGVAGTQDATSTTVVVDNTAPVVAFGLPDKDVTSAGPVSFPISTTADATLDLTKVTLVLTGTAAGTLDTSTAGTVVVKDITGNGTVKVQAAAGAATDAAGNVSGPLPTVSNAVTVDDTAPVATIVRADATDPWRGATVYFNVTLTDANKAIGAITDVTVDGNAFSDASTLASWTAASTSADNKTWQIAVTGMDANVNAGGSAINVLIPAGGVTDTAGNVSTADSALYAPVNGWLLPPTVTITAPANPSPTAADPVVFHIVFNENMDGTLAASEPPHHRHHQR